MITRGWGWGWGWDGQLSSQTAYTTGPAFTGYWRFGGDKYVTGAPFTYSPETNCFAGDLDELAIYPTTLTGPRIAVHYAANH